MKSFIFTCSILFSFSVHASSFIVINCYNLKQGGEYATYTTSNINPNENSLSNDPGDANPYNSNNVNPDPNPYSDDSNSSGTTTVNYSTCAEALARVPTNFSSIGSNSTATMTQYVFRAN